jgi:phosphopantothenoylcysteine decarboxylase/phosphopantothenate--cysteine ligase
VVLIAPASANFIAKLANGMADDLLSTLCLATEAPVAAAPAMNHQMWKNAATQNNLSILKKRGIKLFGPAEGDQACGEVGWGRMLEAHELVSLTEALFETGLLQDLHVVVTAGPTWEALDPVRGISNRSSGKMGYAIAEASVEAGAQVTLISGPTSLPEPSRVQTIQVKSSEQMLQAVQAHVHNAHIFISAAAVADYRPAQAATDKIKKQPDTLLLELVKTPDILKHIVETNPALFTVGFAAETADLEKNARTKLEAKGVDLIAANQVGIDGTGFEADDNQLLLIDRMGVTELPLAPKTRLARAFIQQIAKRYYAKNKTQNTRSAHR